ncbi:protein arv1 isoform X1 [Cinnamomum micranthum f. kanehirae]|uniref:Protein ARV n=1 Tax=Cinnamomum micranthum f. kanehirae TaxID=337451 RepID=A0A3S3QTD6_9MAGN|nr:protein arv1 isoform X1 [Cinnamomum micranthum f. kanehirae]
MEFRCVHCGSEVKTLFVQYSPGNIRLMKCDNCKAVADEYIECEITIVLIDLILHKRKAYRHVLYNVLNRNTVDAEMMMEVLLGNFAFFGVLLLMKRLFMKSFSQVTSNKDIFLAILVSSYFKLFVMAMMVWEFPASVLFIIDIFVLSSNAMALTVLQQATMTGGIGMCLGAHAAKVVANHTLEFLLVRVL